MQKPKQSIIIEVMENGKVKKGVETWKRVKSFRKPENTFYALGNERRPPIDFLSAFSFVYFR